LITKTWTSGTVTFEAGLDASDESDTVEPFTYKMRGAYFSGSSLLSLTSDMYLHAIFSIDLWYMPNGVNAGSLFSKSYNSWSNTQSSDFLDLSISADGDVELEFDSTTTKFFEAIWIPDGWNHFGLIANYDKVNFKTTITTIVLDTTSTHEIAGKILLEDTNSTGAVGARYNGVGGNKTP
jgi:hypothetical protein